MKYRLELEKKIEKTRQEIASLEAQIKEANAYIQGLQEALRMLPKETYEATAGSNVERLLGTTNRQKPSEQTLRRGGDTYKAWQALQKEGKPLYINDLVKAIGKEPTKVNIKSLSGSLNSYIRDGRVFTRPLPNTYGLMEFNSNGTEDSPADLPDDFGMDEGEGLSSEELGDDAKF
jgi:hypothetical protein